MKWHHNDANNHYVVVWWHKVKIEGWIQINTSMMVFCYGSMTPRCSNYRQSSAYMVDEFR